MVPTGKGFIGPEKKQVTVWVSRCGSPQQKLSKPASFILLPDDANHRIWRRRQLCGAEKSPEKSGRRCDHGTGDVLGHGHPRVAEKGIHSAAAANGMRGVEPR